MRRTPVVIEIKVAGRLKIFKMGLLGIPQERIAQRLGKQHQSEGIKRGEGRK